MFFPRFLLSCEVPGPKQGRKKAVDRPGLAPGVSSMPRTCVSFLHYLPRPLHWPFACPPSGHWLRNGYAIRALGKPARASHCCNADWVPDERALASQRIRLANELGLDFVFKGWRDDSGSLKKTKIKKIEKSPGFLGRTFG